MQGHDAMAAAGVGEEERGEKLGSNVYLLFSLGSTRVAQMISDCSDFFARWQRLVSGKVDAEQPEVADEAVVVRATNYQDGINIRR